VAFRIQVNAERVGGRLKFVLGGSKCKNLTFALV
jgi:hypothetical protein